MSNNKTILSVSPDEIINNIMLPVIENKRIEYLQADNLFQAISTNGLSDLDLIIINGTVPSLDAVHLCRKLRKENHSALIPIILITEYFGEISLIEELIVKLHINIFLHKFRQYKSFTVYVSKILGIEENTALYYQDDEFSDIRLLYIESFFDQLYIIEDCLNNMISDSDDIMLERLYENIHKIHGAAGTYGYLSVSNVACIWEELIKKDLSRKINEDIDIEYYCKLFEDMKISFLSCE